jgi:hypothetical protein
MVRVYQRSGCSAGAIPEPDGLTPPPCDILQRRSCRSHRTLCIPPHPGISRIPSGSLRTSARRPWQEPERAASSRPPGPATRRTPRSSGRTRSCSRPCSYLSCSAYPGNAACTLRLWRHNERSIPREPCIFAGCIDSASAAFACAAKAWVADTTAAVAPMVAMNSRRCMASSLCD